MRWSAIAFYRSGDRAFAPYGLGEHEAEFGSLAEVEAWVMSLQLGGALLRIDVQPIWKQ